MQQSDSGMLIWVEGIIGAGKTTFSREVGKRLGLRVIEEPVETNPFLEHFYKDQKTWAYGMQIFLLHTRYKMHQLGSWETSINCGYKGAIFDRSLAGDRAFARLHMEAGNIHPLNYMSYEMAYLTMFRSLQLPTMIVFLDVAPQTAYDRMKARSRDVEVGVPLDYLVKLRDGYNIMLQEAERGLLPWSHAARVVRVPWDPATVTEKDWDHTAETICNARNAIW